MRHALFSLAVMIVVDPMSRPCRNLSDPADVDEAELTDCQMGESFALRYNWQWCGRDERRDKVEAVR